MFNHKMSTSSVAHSLYETIQENAEQIKYHSMTNYKYKYLSNPSDIHPARWQVHQPAHTGQSTKQAKRPRAPSRRGSMFSV